MQHGHVLNKFNLDFLTPSPGSGGGKGSVGRIYCLLNPIPRVGGGWGRGVYGQNIYYHVAAFVTLFNLICKMTMF